MPKTFAAMAEDYALDVTRGCATLYSVLCRPAEGPVDCVWPRRRWRQSFEHIETGSDTHRDAAADGRR